MSYEYKLIKFGGEFCAPCKTMDKAKVLEKFVQKHPNVQVIRVEIADKEGVPYKDGERIAQAYGVSALPTIVIEKSGQLGELARADGGHTLKMLEDLFEQATKRAALGSVDIDAGGPGSEKVS